MGTGTASAAWELWSTRAHLVVTDSRALEPARRLVEDHLRLVDDAANRFRPDSEVMLLARNPAGPVTVSPTLADLLREALRAAALTGGDVDPTVGAALRGLGYDRDLQLVLRDGVPVSARIAPVPGWRTVRLEGRLLTLPPGLQLDLGATAKAVAADRAATLVHDTLGVGVLVSLGGDIATAGPAPDGGWQVRVHDHPDDPSDQVALPAGAALATSSTVQRRWVADGASVHHIVDPRTGRSAPTTWHTVTVAAASCLEANAVSTAAVVRGPAAPAWVEGLGLPARFVREDGAVLTTTAWPRGVVAA